MGAVGAAPYSLLFYKTVTQKKKQAMWAAQKASGNEASSSSAVLSVESSYGRIYSYCL